jgi:16S rRNA processing protein RimM
MTSSSSPSPDELLLIGHIGGAFGLRGQVKFAPITQHVDHLRRNIQTLYIGPKLQPYQLRNVLVHKQGVLVLTLEGVNDRGAADMLRGAEASIRESEAAPLETDEYFFHSLYGLAVVTEEGEELGKVRDVLETGANDVLVVARSNGGEALIPIIQDVVREMDVPGGRIVVRLIPGLLDG